MPVLEDTKELIILEKEEWDKLNELDLGETKTDSTGISYQERKLVIKRVRSLFDQQNDILYPYVIYYNEKGQQKTERLVKADRLIRAIFVKEDDSEIKGRFSTFVEVTTEANKIGDLKQIRTSYTSDIYSWYERAVKLYSSTSGIYFPMPILIRKYTRAPYEQAAIITRDYYEIIALDKEPRFLGK